MFRSPLNLPSTARVEPTFPYYRQFFRLRYDESAPEHEAGLVSVLTPRSPSAFLVSRRKLGRAGASCLLDHAPESAPDRLRRRGQTREVDE
jgi:hypothetical protein